MQIAVDGSVIVGREWSLTKAQSALARRGPTIAHIPGPKGPIGTVVVDHRDRVGIHTWGIIDYLVKVHHYVVVHA